ncbi:hypothetical protein BGX26_008692 [Mortierella sp. AD094]|nr:hypothetical protein BGX26_008692 [Mortierella sp. AD094]
MLLSEKPVLFLSSLVLFATTTLLAHAAPTPAVGWTYRFLSSQYLGEELETPSGPLKSRWYDPNRFPPEEQDRREHQRQQRRIAFRQFSEKAVSSHCTAIRESTLVHLDNVRDFVHDRLKTKDSFELLEPVLHPLINVLEMRENFRFPIEELKVENDASAQIKLGSKKGHGDFKFPEIHRREWTEETDPELLQELEDSGFVQETKVLREDARSLLTCEGVEHVTVAGLEEQIGEKGSDNYVDRYAARNAITKFFSDYRFRLMLASILIDPAWRSSCGLRNITTDVPSNPSGEQPLKEQVVDPSSSSPQDKFVWSNEAMVRMAKAVAKGHREDPEIAAMLF